MYANHIELTRRVYVLELSKQMIDQQIRIHHNKLSLVHGHRMHRITLFWQQHGRKFISLFHIEAIIYRMTRRMKITSEMDRHPTAGYSLLLNKIINKKKGKMNQVNCWLIENTFKSTVNPIVLVVSSALHFRTSSSPDSCRIYIK